MRVLIIAGLLLAACGRTADAPAGNAPDNREPPESAAQGWQFDSSGEGPAMVLTGDDGAAAIRLICPAGQNSLLVNVPAFDPVGSEERLSFGQGGEVVALVADVSGDSDRGGVTGSGAVPEDLVQLLSGRIAASYGSQTSGPHPVPPAALVDRFADSCLGAAPNGGSGTGEAGAGDVSACLIQDGNRIPENRLHAVGTEPFWAANVEGRCVTYSHPEDQDGTRVWTKFSGTAQNGTWTGALGNQPFVMATEPQPGCSDGMSDKRYPVAVTLTVRGEQRRGCAEPR
ncbi:MAG: hypothetical protein ACR2JJ_09775 [Sphingomicrobium sp.]